MTSDAELAAWLALTYSSGFNLARTKAIIGRWCLDAARPLSALFQLSDHELATQLDLTAAECAAVHRLRGQLNSHARYCRQIGRNGIRIITRADPAYPAALTATLSRSEQPLLLYVRGDMPPPRVALAAIVGDEENPDPLTAQIAHDLAVLLADSGVVLLGAMGQGPGGVVVKGAFANGCARALLVAPAGIATVHVEAELARAIAQDRAVILSPFRPDVPGSDLNTRASHRLLAALADAVIVMRAPAGTPTHDLATTALQLGRAVYVWDADPDDTPLSQSHQGLVDAGGVPVNEMADVLDIVAHLTALADGRGGDSQAKPVSDTPAADVVAGSGTMDPAEVLSVLSRAGRIPDVLRNRLQQRREVTVR